MFIFALHITSKLSLWLLPLLLVMQLILFLLMLEGHTVTYYPIDENGLTISFLLIYHILSPTSEPVCLIIKDDCFAWFCTHFPISFMSLNCYVVVWKWVCEFCIILLDDCISFEMTLKNIDLYLFQCIAIIFYLTVKSMLIEAWVEKLNFSWLKPVRQTMVEYKSKDFYSITAHHFNVSYK